MAKTKVKAKAKTLAATAAGRVFNTPLETAGYFHKTLEHDPATGLVKDPADFQKLWNVMMNPASTGADVETIPAASCADKFANPLAAFATGEIFPDPEKFELDPPPPIESTGIATEMLELYWMALLRDVPFTDLASNSGLTAAALADLGAGLQASTGQLTRGLGGDFPTTLGISTLFRGTGPGEDVGPYVSQFWLRDIPYGTQTISQRQLRYPGRKRHGENGRPYDYLYSWNKWLFAQNTGRDEQGRPYEQANRDERGANDYGYVSTMRDLASFVHRDALHQAYFNAALHLLSQLTHAPIWDDGNPYVRSGWKRQKGFGTYGGPHLLTAVSEVASRALQVQWYQKWHVHLRLRPEAYGGLVEKDILLQAIGQAGATGKDAHELLKNSKALDAIRTEYGSSGLLPLAFSSGSPTHPSYGAGHATVAGACVTVLKIYFDDEAPFPGPVYLPSPDGSLPTTPYVGPTLTIGGELNKLASNVAMGRSMGGVHFRTDNIRSLRMGEELAAVMVANQLSHFREGPKVELSFTSFAGDKITISPKSISGYADPNDDQRLTALAMAL